MKKIKVLIFIYQMGGGGAARTLLNIINNLDRSKFAPVLVTLNFNGSYEEEIKDDVLFIKLPTRRLSRSILSLAKLIRSEKIDIVFSTIPRVNTIAIFANLLSFSKARSVVREADNLGGGFITNLQLLGFGLVYRFASQIVSLSEGVKENLVQRYKVKPSDIKVVYNPVDLKSIKEKIQSKELEENHKNLFNTDEKIIVSAGRLVVQKDHHTLLRSFSKVNQEIKSRLVILGEGPLKKELLKEAAELNIEDRVHFIGFQSNPYIYFRYADVFVLSSKHEGFSHVIAEALATGVPVVSTNCKSGPAEVLNRGEYGELCEVGNVEDMAGKILRILSLNQDQVSAIIENGYLRANQFDAKKIVKNYEEIFLKTLNQ